MADKRYCEFCGKELTGRQTKFCSANCRNKELYRVQQSFNERHKRYCPLCGKEIVSLKRIYCSDECSKKALRLREQSKREQAKKEQQEMDAWIKERQMGKQVEVTLTFADIEKGMKETGLSYGEYVARYDQ